MIGLLALVLVLEASAVALAFPTRRGHGNWSLWIAAGVIHAVAVGLMAIGVRRAFRRRSFPGADGVWRLVVPVSFFIPLLGVLGIVTGVIVPLLRRKPEDSKQRLRLVAVPALPVRAEARGPGDSIPGRGSLLGRVRHAESAGLRLGAVMATRRIVGRKAVPILRQALKDPSDEVRLLAFAALEAREGVLFRRIQDLLWRLAAARASERGDVHRQLAESYWEIAYQDLAHGELMTYVLARAREHLELAATNLVSDPGVFFLLGRIQLKQRSLAEARHSFRRALQVGLSSRVVNMHLAEVAFQERKFDEVRGLISEVRAQSPRHPVVKRVVEHWQ